MFAIYLFSTLYREPIIVCVGDIKTIESWINKHGITFDSKSAFSITEIGEDEMKEDEICNGKLYDVLYNDFSGRYFHFDATSDNMNEYVKGADRQRPRLLEQPDGTMVKVPKDGDLFKLTMKIRRDINYHSQ